MVLLRWRCSPPGHISTGYLPAAQITAKSKETEALASLSTLQDAEIDALHAQLHAPKHTLFEPPDGAAMSGTDVHNDSEQATRKGAADADWITSLTSRSIELAADLATSRRRLAESWVRVGVRVLRRWGEDLSACASCRRTFSFRVWRRHCLPCSRAFCGRCTTKRMLTTLSANPLRVCEACFYRTLRSQRLRSLRRGVVASTTPASHSALAGLSVRGNSDEEIGNNAGQIDDGADLHESDSEIWWQRHVLEQQHESRLLLCSSHACRYILSSLFLF